MRTALIWAVLVTLMVAATLWPFLPGKFDPVAAAVFELARAAAFVGFALVPSALGWLLVGRRQPGSTLERTLATATRTLLYFVVGVSALAATGSASVIVGAAWMVAGVVLVRRARLHPLPLVIGPVVTGLLVWTLVPVAHDAARTRTIAAAAPLMADLDAFHRTMGVYPDSLLSLWEDYPPRAIGVGRFDYERNGDGYNLSFTMVALNVGTREIVMYNLADRHNPTSHNTHRMREYPDPAVPRGPYGSQNLGGHWRAFFFD